MGVGRRQKPQLLRDLQGSRKRPYQHRQPAPTLGRPAKPTYLGAIASAKWDELAALLEDEHRLSLADGPWLEETSEAFEDYMRWRAEAKQAALTQVKVMVDGTGAEHQELKTHPAQQQVRLFRKEYANQLKEAGLTPASRARVSVPADETNDDPTEAFLRAVK